MSSFADKAMHTAEELVPTTIRETMLLRAYAALKIPMIGYTRPVVELLDSERCAVRIPLSRRTKNHLGTMYFGALAVGADIAGGMLAMHWIRKRKADLVVVFKDAHADFTARPEADVVFRCDEGKAIAAMIDRAIESGERAELPVHVTATARAKGGEREVARFTLTMSARARVRHDRD